MEFIPIADQTHVSTKAHLTFTLTEKMTGAVGWEWDPNPTWI